MLFSPAALRLFDARRWLSPSSAAGANAGREDAAEGGVSRAASNTMLVQRPLAAAPR